MDRIGTCSIGFRLPLEFAPSLAALSADFRRRSGGDSLRWPPLEALSIDLYPLGESASGLEPRVREVAARNPGFLVSFGELIGVPNRLAPKAVGFGLTGDTAALHRLAEELRSALGASLELPRFEPIFEVAKARNLDENTRNGIGRALRVVAAPTLPPMQVRALEIMRLEAGPRIETLDVFPLASSA